VSAALARRLTRTLAVSLVEGEGMKRKRLNAGGKSIESRMALAVKLSRRLRAKLDRRDAALATEFDAVMTAHAAVVAALFAGEVAELRRELE
jgi:hypothetical protein